MGKFSSDNSNSYYFKRRLIWGVLIIIFTLVLTIIHIRNWFIIIKVITLSLPISLILGKILVMDRLKKGIRQLSVTAALVLGYVIPKLLMTAVESEFLEALFLWVAVELLSFLLIMHPSLILKNYGDKKGSLSNSN